MRRLLLGFCALASLAASGCFYRERVPYDREDDGYYVRYRDPYGRYYRHARWRDEDVWRREDGHWYARRGPEWILRADVDIR